MSDPGRDIGERVTVLEVWRQAQAQALERQALEYERRLTELNHEHDRHEHALQTYVERKVYDLKMDVIDGRLRSMEHWRAWVLGIGAAAVLFAGIVATLVAKLVR